MGHRIRFGLVLCGAMALLEAPAEAGLYHTQNAGTCWDCHKSGAGGNGGPVLTNVTQACLECHNGRGGNGGRPSVLAGADGTAVRQAGFLNGPSGQWHSGHTFESLERAPGGTWTPGPQGLT
jgi:hypothetical protein